MHGGRSDETDLPSDRDSPVGDPVVRGDERITGQPAEDAVRFDPDDPESLARAADVVRSFAKETDGTEDSLYMLRGAAACAALVRGEGSYKAAAERAGDGVTVAFIRKWARVHDLPRSVRRHVAIGEIAPTAAKHVARVEGRARFDLAWAILDHNLPVREVRAIASEIADGTDPNVALCEHGIALGAIELQLPNDVYRTLRRRASLDDEPPAAIVTDALEAHFE